VVAEFALLFALYFPDVHNANMSNDRFFILLFQLPGQAKRMRAGARSPSVLQQHNWFYVFLCPSRFHFLGQDMRFRCFLSVPLA
jgi:hypothetical protein